MDTRRNALSEAEIIAQAVETFGPLGDDHIGQKIGDLGLALEAFYGHGFSDEDSGDVEWGLGHRYRVHRWVMWTDNLGFHSIDTFDTEEEAADAMHEWDREEAELEEDE